MSTGNLVGQLGQLEEEEFAEGNEDILEIETLDIPTNLFTVSELKNPSHDDLQLHEIRRSP